MVIERGGRKFELYDSIKEMPAGRLMAFQLHLTQHHSLGSTFDELDARDERMGMFLAAGRVEDAHQEWLNKRMGFWLMFEGINTCTIALAQLVKAVDGVPVQVRTDEEMKEMARLIESTDISQAEVEDIIEKVKKKVDTELQRYVPDLFNDRADIEHAANVIREAQLKAEVILGNKDKHDEWKQAEKRVLDAMRPLDFGPESEENYQIMTERSFYSLCALLSKEGVQDPENKTALQFYMNIQLLKKRNEPKKSANSHQGWEQRLADPGH